MTTCHMLLDKKCLTVIFLFATVACTCLLDTDSRRLIIQLYIHTSACDNPGLFIYL